MAQPVMCKYSAFHHNIIAILSGYDHCGTYNLASACLSIKASPLPPAIGYELREHSCMSDEAVTRKLAAVLAADVAGYTRLMETDENTTLEDWWFARRKIIDPGIESHGGRIVKHTGDGFLAEFPTTTEAVRCAVELQTALAERNVGRSRDTRFDFRMGINVGEIVVDQEDIYGDGVNIAARLESLADNGGITISALAYEQVKNRLDLEFEDLGSKKLKHIGKPLKHYRVLLASSKSRKHRPLKLGPITPLRFIAAIGLLFLAVVFFSPGSGTSSRPGSVSSQGTPVVSLQPFRIIGESTAEKSFTDGLTEDLMTALSSNGDLRILKLGEVKPDAKGLQALKVGYRLEGSVRTVGDRVRVSAQLVDPKTGVHIWGGRYDRKLDNVLDVQTEVSGKIVSTLKERILSAQSDMAALDPSMGGRAKDVLYRGLSNLGRFAEAAAFLPQELIDWMSGSGSKDLSVQGHEKHDSNASDSIRIANSGNEDWV
jgi:adenylate cyclase